MKAADDIDNSLAEAGLDTLAIRAGQRRSAEGEHSEALFLTSSYVFANAAEAAARFSGDQPGNVYSRYTRQCGLLKSALRLWKGLNKPSRPHREWPLS